MVNRSDKLTKHMTLAEKAKKSKTIRNIIFWRKLFFKVLLNDFRI